MNSKSHEFLIIYEGRYEAVVIASDEEEAIEKFIIMCADPDKHIPIYEVDLDAIEIFPLDLEGVS